MSSNNSRADKYLKRSDSMSNVFFNNPFDFSAYPMTNPPLFDQSMFINYGHDGTPTLRRRISISNGQIGQIINNEAIFDDSYEVSQDTTPVDLNDKQSFQPQQQSHNEPFAGTSMVHSNLQSNLDSNVMNAVQLNTSMAHPDDFHPTAVKEPLAHDLPQKLFSTAPHHQGTNDLVFNDNTPLVSASGTETAAPRTAHPPTIAASEQRSNIPQGQTIPVSQHSATIDLTQSPSSANVSSDHTSFAGVPPPNHQLIYNNEVIYNPNNGPIPGTAAWKRDRLLERNRIAASKCRKRKKQAQQQLTEDLNDLKMENSHLREKLENYDKFFNLIQSFFNKSSNFENIDSSANEFELITKALNSKNQKDLFKVLQDYEPPVLPHIKQEPDT